MHIPGARKGHLAGRLSEAFPRVMGGLCLSNLILLAHMSVQTEITQSERGNRPGYTKYGVVGAGFE